MTAKIRVPMDMHNCFRECDVGTEQQDRNAKAVVDNATRDLLERLSRKRPSWHFVNASYSGNPVGYSYAYRAFVIEDDGERLGAVNAERHWRTGEVWYELTNHRLAAKRQRQGATRTKDINKAVKLIEQHYYGPTIAERIRNAASGTEEVLNALHSNARWTLDRVMGAVQSQIAALLADNPELRAQLVSLAPKQEKDIESIPRLSRNRAAISDFYAVKGSGSNTVMLVGDKLYLMDAVDPEESYTFDTAPRHIAMAVGMLKLVEVKEFIPDVGVRTAHNVFYIMPPQEDTQ